MIKTIIGLILLLVPFLLVSRFKNKRWGFFYILSFIIAFHLFLAIFTQLFHIFSYGVILVINLLACFIILIKLNFKELIENIKRIKIDWILIFVIIILFIQLFSVHYDYTGKITTIGEFYKEVEDMKYVYPYYSDEWYSVSLIKYSIETKSLPLANPLWHNAPFPNLELPLNSFLSEIILLLNLNPLTQYTLLTIFTGLLICLLVYFILRANKIEKFSSAIACLSVPYIVNGANLPGIWTLVPLIMGIISMLLGFLFISLDDKKMVFFMAFLTLIFYPPLFVLYTIGLISYLIFNSNKKIKSLLIYLTICIVVVLFLSFFVFLIRGFNNTLSHIFSKIFYETFTRDAFPDYSIFKIIPIPILMLSAFGIFKTFRKKIWLVAPILIGLLYWLLYSFVLWRFIIEYERVIVSTSILIVLLSGFGLHYLIRYLKNIRFIKEYKILEIFQILILILFLIFFFFYTQRDNWQELLLYSADGVIYNPTAPANNYLHEDDLKLFEGIKEKNFLSAPWKGTVIGVATNNYPLHTKSGTISNHKIWYTNFMNANCEGKYNTAIKNKIDYIYSQKFDCPNFKLIGKSSEGFYLYKVLKASKHK